MMGKGYGVEKLPREVGDLYANSRCFVAKECGVHVLVDSEWCMLEGDLKYFACGWRSGRKSIAVGMSVVG